MAFDLGGAAAIIGPGTAPSFGPSPVPGVTIVEVARLGGSTGSVFNLIATLVTLTVMPANLESELESAGGGAALLAAFSPGGATGLGQSTCGLSRSNDGSGGGEPEVTNPADPTGAGQADAPVERLAPWAQFAVGLDEAWQELRDRLAGAAARPRPRTASAAGPPSASELKPRRASSFLRPIRRGPRRSPAPVRATGPALHPPAKSQEPAGAATNGAWRSRPGPGVILSSRTGFPPVLAAVDVAIEELGESVPRSNRLLQIVPPAADDRSDSPASWLMQIAVASMALSMTWERAVVAGRSRRNARGFRVRVCPRLRDPRFQ